MSLACKCIPCIITIQHYFSTGAGWIMHTLRLRESCMDRGSSDVLLSGRGALSGTLALDCHTSTDIALNSHAGEALSKALSLALSAFSKNLCHGTFRHLLMASMASVDLFWRGGMRYLRNCFKFRFMCAYLPYLRQRILEVAETIRFFPHMRYSPR